MDNWYAIYVKPRQERGVAFALQAKGLATCLPLHRVTRLWVDRKRDVDVPTFPGYVFSSFNQQIRVPILNTPGVVNIVGNSRQATPIDEIEVESLKALERAKVPTLEEHSFVSGERVRIKSGPLTGLTGILLEHKKVSRVVVSVSLLQRSVSVEVNTNDIASV